jgi:hypothetical protein
MYIPKVATDVSESSRGWVVETKYTNHCEEVRKIIYIPASACIFLQKIHGITSDSKAEMKDIEENL